MIYSDYVIFNVLIWPMLILRDMPRLSRLCYIGMLISYIYACEKYKRSPGCIFISADFIIFLPLYLCHVNDASNTSERFL